MKVKYEFRNLDWKTLYELFHSDYPQITTIRERYKKFIDLNREAHLTKESVAGGIIEAAKNNTALYIPPDYPFWNQNETFSKTFGNEKVVLKMETPYRFRKFGPEININTTKMGVGAARETDFKEAMYKKLSEKESREQMLEGTRGMGWWRPRQKDHVLVPWHVFVEGFLYANQPKLGGKSKVITMTTDVRVQVPSLRPHKVYDVYILTLPMHEENNEYRLELFQTTWKGDACEDVIYREMSGKVFEKEPRIIAVAKYSRPEQVICKHSYAAEWKAFENAERRGLPMKSFRHPVPHRLFTKVYNTLKRKTIIGDEKRGERPTKTMITSACGTAIGLERPEAMFVFDL